MSKIDGPGLAATAIGGILLFSGIKGYSVLNVVANLVTGKPIATGVGNTSPLATSDSSTGVITGLPGGDAKQLAQGMLSEYGWNTAEWAPLVKLWQQESSWNNHAQNPSSGAYGIPQALPYSKMPKAAWPESAGGTSDTTAQIQWGLAYIKGRYGTPTMAWAHEQANNWY